MYSRLLVKEFGQDENKRRKTNIKIKVKVETRNKESVVNEIKRSSTVPLKTNTGSRFSIRKLGKS